MDDEKIDLSPLDLAQDPARFERLVARITGDAVARRQRPPLFAALVALMRPALAMAALSVAVIWGGAWFVPARRPSSAAADPTQTLLAWAASGRVPEPGEILSTFGGSHDPGR
ncbi:MAG: hypothetical protein HY903_02980 [Deltaproteobacteria bacterium]|nr:hypothetical protein [Deltaproteobacteria bacterium]